MIDTPFPKNSPSSAEPDLDLERLYLEIDPQQPQRSWQQGQRQATLASRWRAYLNHLALETLLPWLQEENPILPVRPMLASALWPTVWEWVNGLAIDIGPALRLVILPSDALDADELRVPQEWVDMPTWAGDYYLLVQVNPEEGWVKVAGLTTHQQLKQSHNYDWRDRTYSLPSRELLNDLNVVWVSQTLAPAFAHRAALAPLPPLTQAQAQSLMPRLSAETVSEPRLEIDFTRWAALLAHGGWRQQLSRQRWGIPEPLAFGQWLQRGLAQDLAQDLAQGLSQGLTQLAQQLGWQAVSFEPAYVGARGDSASQALPALARRLEIEGEAYLLQISPLDSALADNQEGTLSNAWRFELRKLNGLVPEGVALYLLSEDLQPFENNRAIAPGPIEALYIDLALAPGEGIVWATEPKAAQYDPEILRF